MGTFSSCGPSDSLISVVVDLLSTFSPVEFRRIIMAISNGKARNTCWPPPRNAASLAYQRHADAALVCSCMPETLVLLAISLEGIHARCI